MRSTINQLLLALAAAALLSVIGCKSNGSFEEHEKTAGAEVEAMDEHGDTAIDDADRADDSVVGSPDSTDDDE